MPVINVHGATPKDLPPFLRNRRMIFTTNFDTLANELRYLIEHPAETLDHSHQEQARIEREKRLNELKEYALSLKETTAGGEAKPQ